MEMAACQDGGVACGRTAVLDAIRAVYYSSLKARLMSSRKFVSFLVESGVATEDGGVYEIAGQKVHASAIMEKVNYIKSLGCSTAKKAGSIDIGTSLPDDEVESIERERPRTRRDCVNGLRPCPWVGCQYNLVLDVSPSGSISSRLGHPAIDIEAAIDDCGDTCALDVAERGGATLSEIARLIGVRKERARQILDAALSKISDAMTEIGGVDDASTGYVVRHGKTCQSTSGDWTYAEGYDE